MKYDLTLRKLKNTNFIELYEKFLVGDELNSKQYTGLLAIAISFINAEDTIIQQLGYRIIVEYCNQTENYYPLYEIAVNTGLYPISKFINEYCINDERKNFFTEWNNSFVELYKENGIYESEQQREIKEFFDTNILDTLTVIAPTSYGKSELILSAVKKYENANLCILTSTKSLLRQTKKRIQDAFGYGYKKIIIHPEMYNFKEKNILVVLTQERYLRLLKKDPNLKFDCVIVDEAHELLEDNNRSRTMAKVIIVTQSRNKNVAFKFLTPFLMDANNLKTRYSVYDIKGYKVQEYIKTEKYYVYDIRNGTGLKLYDQFYSKFIPIKTDNNLIYEEEVVRQHSALKNIVYLNKPVDIEDFALSLAEVLPDVESYTIDEAIENISQYLKPQYHLLKCLKKGIIYHHGSVPDAIRGYVENLYKKDDAVKFVITSSTLLSGVNLPAEKLFILDNRKGNARLRPESFKNLVGRICRFSEIFNEKNGSLKRLEPQIFLVFGKYFAANANCESYLQEVAKIEKVFEDPVKNILLENTPIDEDNKLDLAVEDELLENYESGIVKNYHERYIQTSIGKACIMNGITEFDIFEHEHAMAVLVDQYYERHLKINNTMDLLHIMSELIFCHIPEKGNEGIHRLNNIEAQKFYSMFFDWRITNKSYSEMINLFVNYWRERYRLDNNCLVYVGKWGDKSLNDSHVNHYTLLKDKNRSQVVNLAIVRIKEEQDFVDNVLIKFVEVLKDADLLEGKFYSALKYGTENEEVICLIKNGMSLASAQLLLNRYKSYVDINTSESTVRFNHQVLDAMHENGENEIQIFEVSLCL